MSRSVWRRCRIVTLCLAFASALSVQAMSGVAMAGPAPHGSGMTTPMPDGCKDCGGAKGGSGCTMMACATAIGVLADLLRVDPRPASSPVPVRDTAIIGLVTDPDHLPPRR